MTYKLPARYDQLEWWQRRDVRNQYVQEQGGNCSHCGNPLSGPPADKVARMNVNWRLFPDGFRKYPVHLHHSHETGLTIGAVHNYCNAVLWQYHGE